MSSVIEGRVSLCPNGHSIPVLKFERAGFFRSTNFWHAFSFDFDGFLFVTGIICVEVDL